MRKNFTKKYPLFFKFVMLHLLLLLSSTVAKSQTITFNNTSSDAINFEVAAYNSACTQSNVASIYLVGIRYNTGALGFSAFTWGTGPTPTTGWHFEYTKVRSTCSSDAGVIGSDICLTTLLPKTSIDFSNGTCNIQASVHPSWTDNGSGNVTVLVQ